MQVVLSVPQIGEYYLLLRGLASIWGLGEDRLRRRIRFVAVLTAACMLQTTSGCSRAPATSASQHAMEAQPGTKTIAAAAAPVLPTCPAAGAPMLQRTAPGTGHHRIILSWNASTPSARAEDNAVGYCLYRSNKKNAAKKNPTCNECEQVNVIPVAGTSCLDDLVEDGAIYYYVATAINAKGKSSASSNETTVPIPATKSSAKSASPGSYPLCRAPGTLK